MAVRRVREIAGERCGSGERLASRRALSCLSDLLPRHDDRERADGRALRITSQRVVCVASQRDAFDDRLHGRGYVTLEVGERHRELRVAAGGSGEGRSRVPHRRRVDLGQCADAHGEHGRPAVRWNGECFADGSAEAGRGESSTTEAELRGHAPAAAHEHRDRLRAARRRGCDGDLGARSRCERRRRRQVGRETLGHAASSPRSVGLGAVCGAPPHTVRREWPTARSSS